MYTTSELKRGVVIDLDGAPHVVETVTVSTPTARGGNTIYRCKLRNLATKQRVDKAFRGGETFGVADVDRRKVQFLYRDPDAFHFMDQESYDQFPIDAADLEWEARFLVEEQEDIEALYYNDAPLGLELPHNVVLTITETAPAVKGNSATGRTKPATLETGHVIQIPEHISEGTRVSVDTRTGEFLSRVK
jgi:elongation factor P